MTKLIIRLGINAIAVYAAIYFLNGHGISAEANSWWYYIVLGVIFAVVNAVLRPILVTLSCPLILLTLGLGTLLINTLMFYLSGLIGQYFGFGFSVDGFWPAFLGSLIVSVVSFVLGLFFQDELKGRRSRPKPRRDY
jgi:putative membrane protein